MSLTVLKTTSLSRICAKVFGPYFSLSHLQSCPEFLGIEELEKINALCYNLGADYAEIDVLRDQSTQKIYVVDVSRTPAGPPNGLSAHSKLEALAKLSEEFARRFLLK